MRSSVPAVWLLWTRAPVWSMLRDSSWDSLRENPAENAVRAESERSVCSELLEKITDGKGEMEDLDKLEETATIRPGRVLSADLARVHLFRSSVPLKNFRDEYIEHIVDG